MISIKTPIVYAIFLLGSIVIFLLYIIGAARYITDHDENTCDMTYMFEYPQYVRIRLGPKNDDKSEDFLYPRYKLYAYGEGFVTERLRRKHFSGIPVLFIPGNAGSHEQIRSIASVSLRKSLKSHTPFHFDYFTVSFDKDYSALYGGVLKEETEYVSKCIQRIIALYQGKAKSIILIGHSMGGMIAKGALLLVPGINSNVASIVITLATPHKPAVYPDFTFSNYHQEILKTAPDLNGNGTTVISISGGSRDILVPPSQTHDDYADLNVVTTSIPGVWRPTDHLCILWCKQLVLKIVRSLFDCVDVRQKPPAIFSSHERRMKAFAWHFNQSHSSVKKLPHAKYAERLDFPKERSEWIEDIRRQYSWSGKSFTQDKRNKLVTVYLMFRVDAPSPSIDALSIDAVNLRNKDWIFACSASQVQGQSRVCSWGWNLSNRTRIMPGLTRKPARYTIDLDLKEMRDLGASHVVVRIPAESLNRSDGDEKNDDDDDDDDDDEDRLIHADFHSRSARRKVVSSSQSWTIERGALRQYVTLAGINDAASVELKSLDCNDNSYSRYSVIEMLEPWMPSAGQINFFTESEAGPKTIKLQTTNSQQLVPSKQSNAELKAFLDAGCSHEIRVERASLIDRIVCMVRDRWALLYPIIVGLLLLSIGQRFDHRNEDKTNVIIIIIISVVLCASLNLVIECCVAVAILHITIVGISFSVVLFGSVAHNIAVRFLARAVTFSTTWSDWLLGGLVNQLPIVVTGVLLSVIPATCGALAMLLSLFVHFLKLTRMYEDCLEELLLDSMRRFNLLKKKDKSNESSESIRDDIFNEILFFLFWCFAAVPAVPSALVWARNFSFSTRLLTEDPIFLYSWMVMVACGTSGSVRIANSSANSRRTKVLVVLLRCLGWTALAISAMPNAAHYYCYFPPSLALVVLLVALHSLHS